MEQHRPAPINDVLITSATTHCWLRLRGVVERSGYRGGLGYGEPSKT
jgi:hypothetical protein